jgi:hypothetical protein
MVLLVLNMVLEINIEKINVANGLIRDMEGYHIQVWSTSKSPIEKIYENYTIRRNLFVSSSLTLVIGTLKNRKDVGHGAIPAFDPAEVFGAGANLKRRLTSLFIPLNASG